MELRDRIAAAIVSIQMDHGEQWAVSEWATAAADRILAIPEIAEALEAKTFAYNEGYQDGVTAGREESMNTQ